MDALSRAGYLYLDDDADVHHRNEEKRLGGFWFDYVYSGFYMSRKPSVGAALWTSFEPSTIDMSPFRRNVRGAV
ncbi:unnamed protein product [Scytosiphon promiscuus]